jgi:Protein of unknown function (DUF3015)
MKRTFALLLMLSFFAVPVAFAAEAGGGCGLGQQAMQGQTGILPHILAKIINQLTSNTSSMTTGTSGCDTDAVIKAEYAPQIFLAWNMDNVSEEMAKGDGQYLHSLASLMGCDPSAYGEFASMTHEKYGELMGHGATHMEVLSNLKREISASPSLSAACTRVS